MRVSGASITFFSGHIEDVSINVVAWHCLGSSRGCRAVCDPQRCVGNELTDGGMVPVQVL